MSNNDTFEDRIRHEAYRLWEEAGRPHGRDAEFWHQAIDLVDSKPATPAAASESPTPAAAPPAASSVKPKKAAKAKAAAAAPGGRSRKNSATPATPSA